jgi:glyoxylase-like metal-dependent hydrolase (beta-lactamase superfamily II)
MHHWKITVATAALLGLGASPASAQIDFSGMWVPIFHEDQVERAAGPDVGEYAGLPITEAARARALAWDAAILTLPEHQCKPHPSTYGFRGVGNLRIWPDIDDATEQILKLNTHIQWQEQRREIWLDGRAHPPEWAAHTWQGFSTGRWEGSVLVVRTTHLKAGWMRRNGLPLSDRATMTERFIRHGDLMTHVYMIEDPVYLTEPLVKTNGFRVTSNPNLQPYPCHPVVEVPRPKGEVPHHLPGQNPFAEEHAKKHNLPVAAVHGGAETALPEYMRAPGSVRRDEAAARPPDDLSREPVRDGEVHALHVQGNVWMLAGPSGNAAISVGADGVLVVDTMAAPLSDKLLAAIRGVAGDKPIRYIINTSVSPEHTGGNPAVAAAGRSIVGGNFVGDVGAGAPNVAVIYAHEQVLSRMTRGQDTPGAVPQAGWPNETFFTSEMDMYFNGEGIQILHQPGAHTDGDVIVYFRRSDVVVAGNAFVTTTFPRLVVEQGGTLEGAVTALNRIIDLTIPRDKQEGGTYVIPGHGRLTDEADVVEYRDMATIIRDRLKDAVARGLTLQQVKAARMLIDYEGRYGARAGEWTTDAFLEAAYRTMAPAGAGGAE